MNVRIIKARRIDRVDYQVGDIAVFSDRAAAWLIAQRIAEPIDGAAIPTPPRPSAPRTPMPRPQFVQHTGCGSCRGWK